MYCGDGPSSSILRSAGYTVISLICLILNITKTVCKVLFIYNKKKLKIWKI